MSGKRVACLVLLQSVRMEMGSFRKEFSEEKKFTLLSLYFFPLLPCPPPPPFCPLFFHYHYFWCHGLVYLPLSLLLLLFFI